MSFDIEKRFRFVSTDDINDEVDDSDYKEEDIKGQTPEEEEEEHAKKPRLMPQEENVDDYNETDDAEEEEEGEE